MCGDVVYRLFQKVFLLAHEVETNAGSSINYLLKCPKSDRI
jgi:hypothetical protein